MNKDDKQRIIGKVVTINSDKFTIELLTGIDNFNINGFDDIHYFAQLNSYVILPYQNYFIVTEIIGIRERDINASFSDPKEQFLNKVMAGKFLDVIPIGVLKNKNSYNSTLEFEFGVGIYPALYTDVLYIKENELDAIFSVNKQYEIICKVAGCNSLIDECKHISNKRYKTLSIGKSTIFPDYDIKLDIDKFFGGHVAILGNTGSGKSCTISSIIQGLYKLNDYSASGSTFIIFDVNGEYKQAFSELNNTNEFINVNYLTLDEENSQENENFILPNWFLNIDEWALLLQASEKTQLPILRNALGLAAVFSKDDPQEDIKNIKNHILATCITEILRDETGSSSKSDRIIAILQKFYTVDINLNISFEYMDGNIKKEKLIYEGSKFKDCTIANCLFVTYGKLLGTDQLLSYLETRNENHELIFYSSTFQMPIYQKEDKFNFSVIEEAIDIAILYEESHGNRQIRDYCASLITRVKSLKDRPDFKFLREEHENINDYKLELLGLKYNNGKFYKSNQVTILDMSSVDDEVVEVISCVLSRLIYETVKAFEPRNIFPINLILEEAHRYISIDQHRSFLKANKIFDTIAKEGRKFGMFLFVSSQRPSELSKTVLSQCSNFIVHRIQNPEDLSHIRQITPHISDSILRRLPSIPTQHALIFGHAVNIPATFKVNNAFPLPMSDNNRISENWFIQGESELTIRYKPFNS